MEVEKIISTNKKAFWGFFVFLWVLLICECLWVRDYLTFSLWISAFYQYTTSHHLTSFFTLLRSSALCANRASSFF